MRKDPLRRVADDTLSSLLCAKYSRNSPNSNDSTQNCGLFSLHFRLYGGENATRIFATILSL